MAARRKPRLAVFKFASCDGCQLSLLGCEDELLAVADEIEIAYFPEATRTDLKGTYDLTLVEGSITTPRDAERIHRVRRMSKFLVTIGACATSGGIQALRNFGDVGDLVSAVYAKPEYIETLSKSTPIADHTTVDFELRGCPIDKGQLLELLTALMKKRRPEIRQESICLDCKRGGSVCVMVTRGLPCLGPVTMTGCGAVCPAMSRGCYGCFGPKEGANTGALAKRMLELGIPRDEILRTFRFITGYAEAFREESLLHE